MKAAASQGSAGKGQILTSVSSFFYYIIFLYRYFECNIKGEIKEHLCPDGYVVFFFLFRNFNEDHFCPDGYVVFFFFEFFKLFLELI